MGGFMGRAYSEEEKIEIKKRLWEEGIKLFHEQGAEELNIRELTKRAGIWNRVLCTIR